ncbi:MAG: SDR family oxidoreductase, partial [bacterium]|nr:SDR family oxidoreductase [bacterium]
KGHELVLHARNEGRVSAVGELVDRGAEVLVGDLGDLDEALALAEAANELGRMDVVIHNAGLGDGYAGPVMGVNVVAPYVLTALMERPERLVYLSSGMHRTGSERVLEADWGAGGGEYSDSKLAVTALAMAVAHRWPEVAVNAVDPGWQPTAMGGEHATGDMEDGIGTQVWLADAFEAGEETAGYWKVLAREQPHPLVISEEFQERLLASLAEFTGVELG